MIILDIVKNSVDLYTFHDSMAVKRRTLQISMSWMSMLSPNWYVSIIIVASAFDGVILN